ncbi:MAG TPA: cation:proton antiporter [Verrucomicrobiota bacterium]|nr:cation:proton antiporter [Verrucomicrobiota bacterium]
MDHLLRDISICIGTAWLLGVLAHWLRQPVLLAYLVGGFVIGPAGLKFVTQQKAIDLISELGLIFLLFMIGLEIDLKKIASAGRAITVTAAVQVLGGTVLGVVLARLAGFPMDPTHGWDALYFGVAAALSSTVIVVKMLYDKRELDTTAGRITLGVLVLQDLAVILFLAVRPSLDTLQATAIAASLAKVAVLVVSALTLSKFALPALFRHVARLPELVLVGALAWCFVLGEVAERWGLSREMGALIAGISLSTFPYALDVAAKVTSLRDFFVTLFFVGLGMKIPLPDAHTLRLALGVVVFVIVSRFLTVFPPLYALRAGLRHCLVPAVNLCQLSEFSLVLLELGKESNHLKSGNGGALSFAFVLLAVGSTFAMARTDGLVRRSVPWLKRLGLRDLDDGHTQKMTREQLEAGHGHGGARILMLGFFRTASSLLAELERSAPERLEELAVVDFNPFVHSELKRRKIRVLYGDLSQRDTLLHAGIGQAEILICTVPDSLLKGTTNLRLVRSLREMNPKAKIIAPAEVLADVPILKAAGADYVSVSRLDEATDLFEAVRAADSELLGEKQAKVEERIKERGEVLP